MSKQVVHTDLAPKAVGPYVQAMKVGNLIFTSGQLGIDVSTGKLTEGIEAQAHASMKNVGQILAEAGTDFSKAIKCTIFVQDLGDFATVNKIYESYFGGNFPARSCVEVAKLPLGGLVEIECIAEL